MLLIKRIFAEETASLADTKGGFAFREIETLGVEIGAVDIDRYPAIPMPSRFKKEEKRDLNGRKYRFFFSSDKVTLEQW